MLRTLHHRFAYPAAGIASGLCRNVCRYRETPPRYSLIMLTVETYLERIRYSGPREPAPGTLIGLHRAHMLAVPFENLDIHLGRPILLSEQGFYDKIVLRRRGGFCYELNGLFGALLRALHFPVTLLSARVYSGGTPGPEFDHMALLVECEERWIADVGFGDSFLEPLRLDAPGDQVQGDSRFRIECDQGVYRVLRLDPGTAWTVSYDFTLGARRLEEFAPMCRWQQTSPASHFTQKRVCSLATPEGRVTVSDNLFIVTRHGERQERILGDDEEVFKTLKEVFGIGLG
jgi:N-hydroxyarylamine O-acetyltransferase